VEYKGLFKHINQEPTGDYIEIFVSDWNKDHWGFYVYIEQDNYEQDIEDIRELMTKLNYRDGDVYIELINHSDGLEYFYKHIYETSQYSHSEIFNLEYWEILEEKGDDCFHYFDELIGSCCIDDIRNFEYSTYNDWYEVLEVHNDELYKTLDEQHGLGNFDIEGFYRYQGFEEIGDVIVSGV